MFKQGVPSIALALSHLAPSVTGCTSRNTQGEWREPQICVVMGRAKVTEHAAKPKGICCICGAKGGGSAIVGHVLCAVRRAPILFSEVILPVAIVEVMVFFNLLNVSSLNSQAPKAIFTRLCL